MVLSFIDLFYHKSILNVNYKKMKLKGGKMVYLESIRLLENDEEGLAMDERKILKILNLVLLHFFVEVMALVNRLY